MYNLIKKYNKLLIFIIILLTAPTNLYADPDPNLCPNPLNPFELIDCKDIDLPLDSNLYVLMSISIIGVFYTFKKKVILT